MVIFKKSIPRRAFLKGAGAAVALPVLDAMFPALASTLNKMERPRRFSIVYIPNGVNMEHWTPKETGTDFKLPQTLQPLASYRDRMTILTGMNSSVGNALPGEGESAPHERAGGTFLTGVHPSKEGKIGRSVDQLIAQEFKQHTQLASMELALHNVDVVGSCEKGWSCAFMHTLCWHTETTPLPMEYRPRAVFERLFGDSNSTDPKVRMARIKKEKSLLDAVTLAANRLMKELGADDRARIGEYLEGMRDVERRIQLAEQQSSREIPSVTRPAGIPEQFADHLKLMFDLQILAFQTDMTRMITFMTGPERSNRTYDEIGVPDVHHSVSHHQGDPANFEKIAKIDLYHAQLLTYYLDKLDAIQDVDGSLLDNMIMLYGSAMSDGNDHLLENLPVMLLGGGSGHLKGGRHLRIPEETPLSNMHMAIMDKLNINVEKFGDSTGKLNLLSMS